MLTFTCYGHENIKSTHRNTFEITKDSSLTPAGDCIVGVDADFVSGNLMNFVKNHDAFKITLTAGTVSEEITAITNKQFCDNHELVFRTTDFLSERTFGINASKAAKDFSKEFIKKIQKPIKIKVTIETI